MSYAILDRGTVVATAEDLGDGFYKIVIDGKDFITGNIKIWAVECGYTLTDLEDIVLNIHPMYPMQPLGYEFSEVLINNLWDLYGA